MTSARLPSAKDVVLALGTGAVTTAVLLAAPALLGAGEAPAVGGGAWWATVAALWLQALALVVVVRFPRSVLVGTASAAAVLGLVAPTGIGNLADTAVVVAAVRVAAAVRLERLVVALPLAAVLVLIGQAADVAGSGELPVAPALGSGVLQSIAVVALPAAAALAVAARQEARQARSGELDAVRREREALVRAAVAGERTAMARELHDIAAHHLSSLALMSAAIERQIDTDPAAAKRGVRQVRTQSRAMLDDLRRLVGLLRDGAATETVTETLETVPGLVEVARAADRAVDLRLLEADADGVGPLAQLVAYRMVQEALANAAAHAPGAACIVELDGTDPAAYSVTVRNAPAPTSRPTAAGGFGLVGMRERADLVGGALSAGPDAHGGWTVRLRLPRERAMEETP